MSQAILLAGQLVNAEPGKVPAEAAKKLHALLRGEDGKPGLGPQATHSLVQTLKQSAEDLRAAGGSQVTGVVDEVFGTGPLPTKGKIETVGKGLTRFQHQADLMDHLADTLTAHDPEGGNLMVRAAAKNETYKRLTTNPTPGTVINREALHAVLGETLAQGDPTKAVEVAQALAASGVGSPDVGYWQNLLFKDMGAWAQKKESTDFMASSNDAANTATRTVLSGQEDKFQDYLLLNQWNTLDDQLKQAQATFSSFPSAEMEKMVNLYQGQVNKLAGQLKARNLNPGDSITMDSASKLKLNATQAAADARLKMEQAQQESFMKDAATKYQGQVMLPRGNGPADQALQQNIPAPGQSPTAGQPYDPTQPPPPVEMPRPAPIPTQQPQSVAPVSWTPKPGMWQNVRGG